MNLQESIKLIDKQEEFNELRELKETFINKWWKTSIGFPVLDKQNTYWYKRIKEKETNKFINEFIKMIKQYPSDAGMRKEWKMNIKEIINDFILKSDLVSLEDKELLLGKGLFQATEKFVNRAKEFDSSLEIQDIGQAMRNVWIMNIIQMLIGKKIELTPSIFGYSMLYPYTDNYLDDEEKSKEEKYTLSERFERKIAGEPIKSTTSYENKIYKLIDEINSEYERDKYPLVYKSLLYIHRAQTKSLKQHKEKSGPYEDDILGISIEKGGASVLADAYLINGNLRWEEAKFFFGYGVLLQICDDLQDAENDSNNNHITIISQLARKWPLDNVTNKLINFTLELLDNVECFNTDDINELKELIKKNCLQLILFSIAQNKKLYTRKYFKEIKRFFPYRVRYMRKLYKKLERKLSKLDESYNGVSTDKIIKEALV
ncbi:hypothetical protein [Sporosalibacterium faouarense]|uniref:hypothetical protein n=1 Tax=Sporosalibacterium faouarense TaxID=516123 RepID=UPI00192BB001|nr:hypothetical protein [Sporosalibacterium faouarense]